VKFVATKKGMTTNFFSPLSFVAVFGSGIRDPGSGMGIHHDPEAGIRDEHPESATLITIQSAASHMKIYQEASVIHSFVLSSLMWE
jgi:hypothetical protein